MTSVAPGDCLGSLEEVQSGQGTYVQDGQVYASRCGAVSTHNAQDASPSDAGASARVITVTRGSGAPLVPSVGDVVTARVLKLTPRMAVTEILCIGAQASPAHFTGIIRLQDVRALEVDKVKMGESFRPGDLVRAEVLSLGTMRDYYLTTAKNELGVIWARSLAGAPMAAVSWEAMRCPETAAVEKRKVAKVVAPVA